MEKNKKCGFSVRLLLFECVKINCKCCSGSPSASALLSVVNSARHYLNCAVPFTGRHYICFFF